MKQKHAVKRPDFIAWLKKKGTDRLALLSISFGIAGQVFLYINKNIPAGLFFFIIAVFCLALSDKKTAQNTAGSKIMFQPPFPLPVKTEVILFSLILMIAAFMRLYRLDSVPAGCFYDEAINGRAALDILSGGPLPVYTSNNAAVFLYFIAAIFKFFGIGAAQIRLASALLGILAVPAVYFLIRYLAGPALALAGSFLLAVTRWHIIFSRIGFHAAFAVLALILVLYFAVRAYYEKKALDFVLLGGTLGFSLYTYQGAYLIPFILLVFVSYIFFRDKNFIKIHYRKITASLAVAAVVFLPLGIYIYGNLNSFTKRHNQVSILNQTVRGTWSTEDQSFLPETRPKIRHFLDNVKDHLLMFNYRGDVNERHNLPGQPELDFFAGIFAFIGFGYALTRFFHPVYFLFITGFIILMSAGFLSIEAPQSLRTILALPCVIFFMLVFAGKFLSSFVSKRLFAPPVLIIAAMLLLSWADNYNIYFNKQARDPGCWSGFSTQEYSAGKIVRSALLSGYNAATAPYYMKHPSFKFALTGVPGCGVFDLSRSIPAESGDDKNFMYLLPVEYACLEDFLKELYPHGTVSFFANEYSGDPVFFYYAIPSSGLKGHKPGMRKNGANVTYFAEHGFKNELSHEKMPVILHTWYDNSRPASAIWRAKLNVPSSDDYTFHLRSRGYSSLVIDKKTIAGNAAAAASCDISESTASVCLKKGIHAIEVKYDSNISSSPLSYGCKGLWLLWKKSGDKEETIIPGALLYPD